MEAPDSANTEMNYDHIESTIQPEETQPEAAEAEPEQPLDIPKPNRKGRPPGTKDAYKRARKNNTKKHTYICGSSYASRVFGI